MDVKFVFRKDFVVLFLLFFGGGCASMQVTRKPLYISEDFKGQLQKNIMVVSLIDARIDKGKDLQKFLSNKIMISEHVLNPLRRKGYSPQFISVDTSACGSLSETNAIGEIRACLGPSFLEKGGLFLLISIDSYSPPKGMGVNGYTKVTGIIYSHNVRSVVWKDSIEGYYDTVNTIMYGFGGYAAKMMLKTATPDFIFRSNAIGSIKELLSSMPPFPRV